MQSDHARRARALLGTRFRPQGRNPDHGLDCVGLILTVFDLPRDLGRRDYRLRGDHRAEVLRGLTGPFRRIPGRQARPGDVLVMQVAADQLHLAVLTGAGFVHADAGLGKVVETPGEPAWPVIAVFRRRRRATRAG